MIANIFNAIICCIWPFLLGVLLGWLLNKLLCKCRCGCQVVHTHSAPAATAVAEPVASAAPVAAKAVEPAPVAIDLAAARAAGFTIKHADDLTVIEGIGPKINELFNNDGIRTFAQLATQTAAQMQAVLDKGGARFRMANPQTWAQQAALAAANKWVELKKLQDELSGGLRK